MTLQAAVQFERSWVSKWKYRKYRKLGRTIYKETSNMMPIAVRFLRKYIYNFNYTHPGMTLQAAVQFQRSWVIVSKYIHQR